MFQLPAFCERPAIAHCIFPDRYYGQIINKCFISPDIDKQFTISVFKTINLFLQTVLGLGEEAKLHLYPDQEERPDPLSVDKKMLHPESQLTSRLLNLVQVDIPLDF